MYLFKLVLFFSVLTINIFAQELNLELLYKKYSLPFIYPYKKENREFQIDKILTKLELIDYFQWESKIYNNNLGTLKNYKNLNGRPPATPNLITDQYGIERDAYGTPRYQGIPLYSSPVSTAPDKYARDGEFISFSYDDKGWAMVLFPTSREVWYVPSNYVRILNTREITHIVTIDIKNQNIMTLEKNNKTWLIRSITHSTTGVDKPPYSFPTPPGLFILQSKLKKMDFLKDGSYTEIEGFAPFASRFSGGAYVHGIPVLLPKTEIIETSPTLGTIPRSHKCVRTHSSHAEFIYNWAPIMNTLFMVID